ncbi:protein of unassigned function [Methylobacterium oryzae CBMB20]|uniref:Protein of unassigned function n=1 Tax=Methylobacterium oryzae CBMB20 TaxID=693986 RepID=A0A089NVJ0_9HYPH|nr:protein of unassigned function [Methylobacterium oryzae CBMB20]
MALRLRDDDRRLIVLGKATLPFPNDCLANPGDALERTLEIVAGYSQRTDPDLSISELTFGTLRCPKADY